ncbi:MAG: 5-(carboxyamino)imidazole ribonucleotide mutase [Candidatus Nanopelagicales bacterium]|jgi:5-(carboxyamino)imidazole ribonucleotide mutase
MGSARVAVIMGSDSDWPVMKDAAEVLTQAGIQVVSEVVSAHRTPEKMVDFAKTAADRGFSVIIAGAGGAAHLPGMVASLTPLPVIGVPVPLATLDGMDSLLSIVQMPPGIPVATVGIGQARNAGILAMRILALTNASVATFLKGLMESQTQASLEKVLPQP